MSESAPRPDARRGPRELCLSAADHVAWARAIARGVRADAGFRAGSDEELELEGTALLVLARLVERFDEGRVPPGGDLAGAFRGYASRWVRNECRRHAERLRNGGLYATTRGGPVRVVPLPQTPDGEDDVADYRGAADDAD